MSNGIYQPKDGNNPFIKNIDEYKNLYEQSINNPSKFFSNLAKEDLSWIKDFTSVHNEEFANTKWFEGGKINISVNCIDRHLKDNPDKIAVIWEGDNPNDSKELTFQELHDEVCKFANVLKSLAYKYKPLNPFLHPELLKRLQIYRLHHEVLER